MARLQPKEIPSKLEAALEKWQSFSDNSSLQSDLCLNSNAFESLQGDLDQVVTMWSITGVLHEISTDSDALNHYRPS